MDDVAALYGFIVTSKLRHAILRALATRGPALQSEVAARIGKRQQDISKAVRQLECRRLVSCLTPHKGSYKAYVITPLGRETLRYQPGMSACATCGHHEDEHAPAGFGDRPCLVADDAKGTICACDDFTRK